MKTAARKELKETAENPNEHQKDTHISRTRQPSRAAYSRGSQRYYFFVAVCSCVYLDSIQIGEPK